MIKWRARYFESPDTLCSSWVVEEIDDDGEVERRIVDCGQDEVLARRIATLPEVEAELVQLRTRLFEADACIEHLYRDGAGFRSCERVAAYFKLWRQNPDGAEEAGS